jgi:signal transduction histidine kinase/DNA-binding response OmpR family regulator
MRTTKKIEEEVFHKRYLIGFFFYFLCCFNLLGQEVLNYPTQKMEWMEEENDTLRLQEAYGLMIRSLDFQPDLAIYYIEESIRLSKKLGFTFLEIDHKASLVYFLSLTYRFDEAFNHLLEAQKLLNTIPATKSASAYEKRHYSAKTNQSLKSTQDIKWIAEAYVHYYAGFLNASLGDSELQLYDFEQALYIREKKLGLTNSASELFLVGDAYLRMDSLVKAMHYFQASIEDYGTANMRRYEAAPLNGVGQIYLLQKEYVLAASYFKQALESTKTYNNYRYQIAVLINLSRLYVEQNKIKAAKKMANQAIALLDSSGIKSTVIAAGVTDARIHQAYLILSKCLQSENKIDSALTIASLGYQMKDSLQTTAQFYKKQFHNAVLKENLQNRDIETSRVANQNTQRLYIFFVALGLLSIIAVLLYRNSLQNQKSNRILSQQKQGLKELNDFKTRFFTNITHEFRTPLTVIMGMSDNLKNNPQEKKLIQRNSQNLLRLINQLLDLSKLESGKLDLNLVHRDLIVYLEYLTESFYSTATQKNIRLVFYSEEKEVWMDYDEEKIQQIVYNLLSNALKFTPKAGRIIFHANKVVQDGEPFLKLKIKDNGIGMLPEHTERVFDRFYQVNEADTKPSEGTGIGLSLTKELVELMHGRIEVESQLSEGSEFTWYLPIETRHSNASVALNGKNAARPYQHPTLTNAMDFTDVQQEAMEEEEISTIAAFPDLLIIEDNSDIITYIQSILKNSYNIQTANNGKLGIEKALDLIPDIIISDVMMPEKNGYEVCEHLKQDERTSHIPIILLTAKSTQSDKIDGLKHGADAYLTKPFNKEELLVRLQKLVEIRQQLQIRYVNSTLDASSPIIVPSIEDLFLQKLQEQIQLHLNDTEFGVPQLADSVQRSQMQLYRKLKALTDRTPSQFIRSYRLQKALTLLQARELNISEIAYKVGFSDPSYFSRMFHKEFGKNPSQFLNN